MQEDRKKFTFQTKYCRDFCRICIIEMCLHILLYEVRRMKEEEKKPQPWEAVDPKPPVIHSGPMENRKVM